MTKTVLITTSGTGERLGSITKYTNKSLVNVGDKYAICHIIENYESNTEFIITIGYYGNLVKDFLFLVYPDRNLTFVNIDNYDGDGSSLGYSLLQAKKFLKKPFIFHCCDAIVVSNIYFEDNKNTLCVVKNNDSSQYTNIKVMNNTILEINNKKHNDYDYIYTGISYIYDYSIFWENLEIIYNSNKFNKNLSDVDVIRKMLNNNYTFQYCVLNDWYDTGNIDSYNNLQKYFKTKYNILKKNNESLCFFDDIVIKFINNKDINKKRIQRGNNLYPLTPKIINHSDNFMVMEKIDGIVLSEYYKHGEIKNLLIWAKKNLWINQNKNNKFKENCYNFYINKTKNRICEISFLKEKIEINVINGINTGKINELIDIVSKMELITTDTFCHFHGDFILDNIIKTKDSYILIDWRHEFDNQEVYGDLYYDLAKLRHNIIFNHKNILENLFEIDYIMNESNNNDIVLDLKCNYFLMQQLNDYDTFISENNYDLKKVKILTSIIWINMSPLYEGKLSEFLFYLGKYNLFLSLQ
jgi:NDP-sugar pyrophosphorylase family protein